MYIAALEELALSKTSEIPRLVCVAITRPRRAFLQFLHPKYAQSPLAGVCSALFCATVSRFFCNVIPIKKVAACATFYWARGLFFFQFFSFSELNGFTKSSSADNPQIRNSLSLYQYLSYSSLSKLASTHTLRLLGFTEFLYLYKSLAHPLETQSASQLQEF